MSIAFTSKKLTKQASDIFDISPKLLQIATDVIIDPLTNIFNESLMTDIVPEKFKTAIVHLIYKKECKI